MFKNALMKTASRFTGIAREEDGAVAVWFAILLIPMLGFTFGAIKYTELSEQRANMVDAMDASALAMARWVDFNNKDACQVATGNRAEDLEDREEVIRFAREYFAKNYPNAGTLFSDRGLTDAWDVNEDLFFDMTCSNIVARTNAFHDMGGILARYFNVGAVPLNTTAEITLAGAGRVEIALVLDLSGSMRNDTYDKFGNKVLEVDEEGSPIPGSSVTRLEGLQEAVKGMLDELFGNSDDAENEFVRVGIVPFNSIVNVGSELADKNLDWFDGSTKNGGVAAAPWHGSEFIHVEQGLGASRAQKLLVTDRKVNHFDLFASVPGIDWAGCVESRPFPLDELPDAPGTSLSKSEYDSARVRPSAFEVEASASASTKARIVEAWNDVPAMPSDFVTALNDKDASLFVPWFYLDEPDCFGIETWHSCRTYEQQKADDTDVPAWAAPYSQPGDDPASLLDHPKHGSGSDKWGSGDRYWMPNAVNAGFLQDRRYIDFFKTGESGRWYHDFILDFRNSWESENPGSWCAMGAEQKSFHNDGGTDISGDDEATFVALARRHGITGGGDCHEKEYRLRQAYVGIFDSSTNTYKHKYDKFKKGERFRHNNQKDKQNRGDPVGPNHRCGEELMPLKSKKNVLVDYVDGFEPYGGTNSAIGMAWGYRMLTKDTPLAGASDPATPEGQKWRKFAILMSDGKNNINEAVTANLSGRNAYGFGYQDRLNIVDKKNPTTWDVSAAYNEEIDHKTIRICHRMQAEGIKVYTVGYGLNREKDEDKRNKIINMLKACANSAEGTSVVDAAGNPTGVTFVNASDASELQKAFEDITDAIEELHISG